MSWDNIQVRIRYASEGTARPFGSCSAGDLDAIIPTLNGWGVLGEQRELTGQFDPEVPCFEVVIEDDD